MHYFETVLNDFVAAKEACRFYKIHPATLLRWARDGKVRYRVGLGGRNRQYELVKPNDISNDKPSETDADV